MKKKFSMAPLTKKMLSVLLSAVFLLPLAAQAEIKAGSVELSPFVGYNFYDNQHNIKDRQVFGGRIGYNFTNHFGLEGTGEFAKTRVDDKNKPWTEQGQFTGSDDVKIISYHLDLLYHFMPEEKFNPFVTAGYGASHYNPEINSKNMRLMNVGVGAKYWVAENIALRVDLSDKMTFDEQLHNLSAAAGVVFAFGGESAVAPVERPADSDNDGVADSRDKCPNTPTDVAVDTDGCPLDADKDGVPDYLDKCPGTPAGVAVDQNGCPLDSDKDGVANSLDKCPDTPAGVVVDKDGCPKKVVILASEPKVEEKVKVAAAEPAEVVVLAFEDIHFDYNQSTLTPEAKVILKRNIQILSENPKAHIRIAGYTSASGTEKYNQTLSEKRANSIKEYLVSEGVIKKARLTTVGYGETQPAVYEAAPKDLYSNAAKANMRVLFEVVIEE
ncbi:MAG: outer membrane beta-barrel domain-containing protein [Deltaproteobacteria bacterium HGW-Deltaproteobacteria-4]|nr:MAG: outer membrane beta-barrel domain-containing protein [Deltaproteobacteria bacterium HGW-Deltaproteobacteria-4]